MVQRIKSLLKAQRGSVIIFYAIIFLTLWVPFVGLVMEYGRYLVLQSQLQNAADAAAMSAADIIMEQNQKKNKALYNQEKDYTISAMQILPDGEVFNPAKFDEKSNRITWEYLQQLIDEEKNVPIAPLERTAYRSHYGKKGELADVDAREVETEYEKIILQNYISKIPTDEEKEAFKKLMDSTGGDAQSFYCYYQNGSVKKADYYAVYFMKRMDLAFLKYIGADPISMEAMSVVKVMEK